jgi:uncharacterized protein
MKKLIALSLFFVSLYMGVKAQESDSFKFLSGLPGGSYMSFATDIKEISSIPIEVLPSGGSIENMKRLLNEKQTKLTFIQYDVLAEEAIKNPKIKESLKVFLPILFIEEIHVITLKEKNIATIHDLVAKKVAIGDVSQGTNFTAKNIKKTMGLSWVDVEINSNDALQVLLNGDIDAFFYVGAAPIQMLQNVDSLTQTKLQLVSLKDKAFPLDYARQQMKANTYAWQSKSVETYGVLTVLMVKTIEGEVDNQIEKIYADINTKMKAMQAQGHEKWNYVYDNFRRGYAQINWSTYVSDPGE